MIKEIKKNSKEVIRISQEEYKGNTFIDLRIYFENEHGEYLPTKKVVNKKKDKKDYSNNPFLVLNQLDLK